MEGTILSQQVEGGAVRVVISVLDDRGQERGPFAETWGLKDDPAERLAGFMRLQEYSCQNAIDRQESPDEKFRSLVTAADPEVVKRVLLIDDAALALVTK